MPCFCLYHEELRALRQQRSNLDSFKITLDYTGQLSPIRVQTSGHWYVEFIIFTLSYSRVSKQESFMGFLRHWPQYGCILQSFGPWIVSNISAKWKTQAAILQAELPFSKSICYLKEKNYIWKSWFLDLRIWSYLDIVFWGKARSQEWVLLYNGCLNKRNPGHRYKQKDDHKNKARICMPRKEISEEARPTDTLTSSFQTWRNKLCVAELKQAVILCRLMQVPCQGFWIYSHGSCLKWEPWRSCLNGLTLRAIAWVSSGLVSHVSPQCGLRQPLGNISSLKLPKRAWLRSWIEN